VNPEKVASSLQENERKILLALRGRGPATTEELSAATGLSRDAVEKACAWAKTKGVVSIEEKISRSFKITDEGHGYVVTFLPEKQLLREIKKGNNEIKKLPKTLPLQIALAWAKKKDWIKIQNGKLYLTEKGKNVRKIPIEQLLIKLNQQQLNEKELTTKEKNEMKILLNRKLASVQKKIERRVDLSEFGRKVLLFLGAFPEGRVVTQLTPELLKSGAWRGATFQRYDVNLPVPTLHLGKRHFISQVIDYIRRFWVEMGFKEMKGPLLELAFWNFDALYQPQDHPARDLADTFYMRTPRSGRLPDPELVRRVRETHENGWTTGSTGWRYRWDPDFARRCCLRTHTTSLSVNTIARLREEDLPAKFFSVGRVFRNESIDWNHLVEFYQTDGIVVGGGVTFRNLLGYLKEYLEKMGLKRFRFRPGYFPYTEMSLEAEVWIEERQSWMELFGAGMFRPEVVKPLLGREVPVLAWGPGFDRIVMRHYGISNLKELYSNDLGQLREAKLWVE